MSAIEYNAKPDSERDPDVEDLRRRFAEEVGRQAPIRASQEWLYGNIQWAAQARAAGQDPRATRTRLLDQLRRRRGRGGDYLAPGSRLVRTWNGVTHEISVLERGFEWRGERYRSLSAIAEAITGTRWSGPRFFGLRDAT